VLIVAALAGVLASAAGAVALDGRSGRRWCPGGVEILGAFGSSKMARAGGLGRHRFEVLTFRADPTPRAGPGPHFPLTPSAVP